MSGFSVDGWTIQKLDQVISGGISDKNSLIYLGLMLVSILIPKGSILEKIFGSILNLIPDPFSPFFDLVFQGKDDELSKGCLMIVKELYGIH